ncbi:MAG: hypothetical protein LBJ11_02860 [Oscillospiraceae bacterium]|jgi:hypothetical protein|nr:hypothetical protein [Oscillospiraceae bacterium]
MTETEQNSRLVFCCGKILYPDPDSAWEDPAEKIELRAGYQLLVWGGGAGEGDPLLVMEDVCTQEAEARELERLLRENDVALCHVRDLVEDFLEERYG